MHALVILSHFHALSSFVFGCGIGDGEHEPPCQLSPCLSPVTLTPPIDVAAAAAAAAAAAGAAAANQDHQHDIDPLHACAAAAAAAAHAAAVPFSGTTAAGAPPIYSNLLVSRVVNYLNSFFYHFNSFLIFFFNVYSE